MDQADGLRIESLIGRKESSLLIEWSEKSNGVKKASSPV